MKTQLFISGLFLICNLMGCSKGNDDQIPIPPEEALYFPPLNSDEWKTVSLEELDWNSNAEQPLYDFLETNKTEAFILLKDGKIVMEKYFGSFNATKNHSWNSAAKTLTAFTVGIAQKEGHLALDHPSSDYMGTGWSSLSPAQEAQITVKNHLTMTTGLDYTVENNFCTDAECLIYKDDPNSFWYYHNATYTLLDNIISGAVDQEYKEYFNNKVRDKIGMQGSWVKTGYLNLYFSNARSMARFGLLNLNKGIWGETVILDDPNYFTSMTTTSQELNKSYGYLWWLNGKSSFRLPGTEELYPGKLIPNAPDDLIAGLGAFDQKLYVVPSKGLVIIRMGDSANEDELGPSTFDNDLWGKINAVIN
ncbi:serine hydrolase domain-containing protein [Arenibacter sp. M-2]|uniref:serine hydrolase domain-containing protein n=1 Tax=Arenibacter sp. M-2 TaxID=3053612 RepID=UPI002570F923|nr:serine hydrolase domain-containing protein [Arenibacter sp. M-2]MDL5513593.1 serine hydrolase domain-containing protein [Arenibacter sp. M-2]